MRALAFALLLVVSGCAGIPLTPAQSLFDIQTRYTVLGAVVLRYVELPPCITEPPRQPAGVTVVNMMQRCADPETVETLQGIDQEAYDALVLAEVARGHVNEEWYHQIAQSALARLRAVIVAHAIRETLKRSTQ